MEQLRKVVAVGCLTYLLYGLISWFQLGIFLPPLPVKPVLFFGFIIFGLVHAIQSVIKILDVVFFLWLTAIVVINQNFLEFFFSTLSIISFLESNELIFQLLAVLLFFAFNTLIIFSLSNMNAKFSIYFLLLIVLIVMVFAHPNLITLERATIIMGVVYFLTQRLVSKRIVKSLNRTFTILTGITIIEVIETIALLQ